MRIEAIQADFDRIARLIEGEPDRPDRYESFLLAQLPDPCRQVLDVGCGTGRLARAIARRGAHVTGIDASAEMIRLARQRTRAGARIEFVCADFSVEPLDSESYDAVVSVATVHHLPVALTLSRMSSLVRPGGVLVVNDLRAPDGKGDWLRSAIAAGFNGDAAWWLRNRLRATPALLAAWRDHGLGECYLTMEQVRALCETSLPGARCHWHPLWRYTVVWTKGEGAPTHLRR